MSSDDNFEKIITKFKNPLSKFIYKRLGANKEIADEVLSQTMIAAWKGWHTFNHKSGYFTWICRIALNKIADYYRGQVNRKSEFIAPFLEGLVEPVAPSFEERMALDELKKSVNQCLDLLPEKKRQILQLRYWQEASLKEISQLLGISEKGIEAKLYRARKSFAKLVAKAS
jgi:RNA polymerase sigma-70 factor, ECF subfamily